MKKLLSIVIGLAITICMFAGCSNDSGQNAGSGSTGMVSNPQKDEIKVDQIDWKVENAVIDKYRRVVFSYTNKSKFKIANIELDFSLKPDVTKEMLRDACEPFKDEGWSDQTLDQISNFSSSQFANLTLAGEWKKTVAPGDTSGEDGMTIGLKYINGMEQYDLFEPSMLIIKYLVADGKLYEETYDFKTETYSLSSRIIDTRQWSDSELANQLPHSENLLVIDLENGGDYFEFETLGTTSADFEEYIAACKEKGFIEETRKQGGYSDEFDANSADGKYKLSLSFIESTGQLTARVKLV